MQGYNGSAQETANQQWRYYPKSNLSTFFRMSTTNHKLSTYMEKVTCWSEYTLHPNRQGDSPWEREKYGEVSQSLNRKDSSWRESDWNLFSNETNSAVPREDSSDKQRITSKYTNVNTKKEYFWELSEKVKVEVSIGFSGKMAQLKVEWESESGRKWKKCNKVTVKFCTR